MSEKIRKEFKITPEELLRFKKVRKISNSTSYTKTFLWMLDDVCRGLNIK